MNLSEKAIIQCNYTLIGFAKYSKLDINRLRHDDEYSIIVECLMTEFIEALELALSRNSDQALINLIREDIITEIDEGINHDDLTVDEYLNNLQSYIGPAEDYTYCTTFYHDAVMQGYALAQ